jgi:hypothetical protein
MLQSDPNRRPTAFEILLGTGGNKWLRKNGFDYEKDEEYL